MKPTFQDDVNELKSIITGKKTITTIPDDFNEFNKLIGLPKHPITFKETPLIPYQLEFFNITQTTKHHKFHINKARQIGFTEEILRILAYHSFHKYAGGKIKIIAGTRESTAKKIMHRFKMLFYNIPQFVKESNDKLMVLTNGTEIEALPSNSESIRGDTKIKAIFLDEAAHFNLRDDSVVMDAIGPIVDTNQSDLFMISTPNGPQGFFYDIDKGENDYLKLKYKLSEVKGYLYTDEEINSILSRKDVDVEQEYLNQYTTGRTSIFGNEFTTGDHELGW